MTPEDPLVRAFLERSLVSRIATRSPKGWPSLTPLWFVCDGGLLYATTGLATLAARNAASDPRVAVLLDAESGGGRSAHVLRLVGRARVETGVPSWRVLARFAAKYYLGGWRTELAHASRWALRGRYYAQAEAATIVIAPERAELLRAPRLLPGVSASAPARSRPSA